MAVLKSYKHLILTSSIMSLKEREALWGQGSLGKLQGLLEGGGYRQLQGRGNWKQVLRCKGEGQRDCWGPRDQLRRLHFL